MMTLDRTGQAGMAVEEVQCCLVCCFSCYLDVVTCRCVLVKATQSVCHRHTVVTLLSAVMAAATAAEHH